MQEEKVSDVFVVNGPLSFSFPQPIATISADCQVQYKGRPITHEELCEAIHLWLIYKRDLPLGSVCGRGSLHSTGGPHAG